MGKHEDKGERKGENYSRYGEQWGFHMKEGDATSNISEEMVVACLNCKVYLFGLLSEWKVEKYVVSQSIFSGRDIEAWRITD